MKHTNLDYSTGIANATDDNTNVSDYIQDFWSHRESIGQALETISGGNNLILSSAGNPSQSTGYTIAIPAIKGIVKYSVTIPADWTTKPPPTTTADITVLVETTNQTISASTATVGSTNYVKVRYAETMGTSRTKAHAASVWNCYATPSFSIVIDNVAPSTYDISLASFTTNGTTITWTGFSSAIGSLLSESILARNADNITSGTINASRITNLIAQKNVSYLDGYGKEFYTNADNLSAGSVPAARLTNAETVVERVNSNSTEFNVVMKHIIIKIGAWNMTTPILNISLNLGTSKIPISAQAVVWNDAQTTLYNLQELAYIGGAWVVGGCVNGFTTSAGSWQAVLGSSPVGLFNSADFDSTGLDRGYVVVSYIDV